MDPLPDAPGLSGPPEYVLWCEGCGERIIVQSMGGMKLILKNPFPVLCNDCHMRLVEALAAFEEDD